MVSKVSDVLKALHSRLLPLYGDRLEQMVLYGSQARKDAQPDSDIDVLVVLNGPVSPCEEIVRTEYIVSELSLAHNVTLACVFVSKDDFDHKRSPLLLNIRREGIPL